MLEQISEAPQQQSLEIRQLITEEPILIYIDRCILTSDDKPKPSKPSMLYKRLFLATKVSAGVIGLLGGIPWMNPSKNAAIIFPDGVFRNMFEIIFQAGIVITVGVDSSWIMYSCIDKLKSVSKEKRILTEGKGCSLFCARTCKIILPVTCSFLACIAPTYASFIYNEGWERYFSIIAFVINYGYAFVGYSELANQFFPRLRDKCSNSTLIATKRELISKTNQLCAQESVSFENVDCAAQLIRTIRATDVSTTPTTGRDKTKKIFLYTSAFFVPIGMSVVRVFLTKDFLQTEVYNNNIFTISAAIFCETPVYVVGFLSTYITFGRLFDFITCNNRKNETNKCTNFKNLVVSSSIFLLSLTAPTAAAYMAYATIDNVSFSSPLSICAAVAISVNCVIFSNFTLKDIVEVITNFFTKKNNHREKHAGNAKKQLQKLGRILPNVHPKRFECLNPLLYITLNT